MSTAHGHVIALMSASLETRKFFGHVQQTAERIPAHGEKGGPWFVPEHWRPSCQGPRCDEKPVYVTRYFYVTGRAGRTTDRIQYACPLHGEAFAKKHGLQLPPMRDAGGGASAEATASERGDSNMVTATTSAPEATSPQGKDSC